MAVDALDTLINALRCLPGIGPKSSQRLAYHLLQNEPEKARHLGQSLLYALEHIKRCQRCNNFSDQAVCPRCASDKRDARLLCVVETPIDLNMMEQTQAYNGLYFVLMGRISPLDGQDANRLKLNNLMERIHDGVVQEVILATNFTHEGEATAHFLTTLLNKSSISVSRIARGVPVGGELEYVDSGTLAQALRERRQC